MRKHRISEEGTPGPGAGAAAIQDLAVGSPLWQLKINCLQYCRLAHMHHHGESVLPFPQLRRSNPALGNLSDELLAHLDYEEEKISATLRTWPGWPGW
jgi:hypothetical protein